VTGALPPRQLASQDHGQRSAGSGGDGGGHGSGGGWHGGSGG